MASLAHLAVGVAAGRLAAGKRHLGASLLCASLSMLPDADVVAFLFGIPYAHPFGHRGASHSIVFALCCGILAWGLTRARRGRAWRWGGTVTLTVLSHPLLDMLTTGGLGVALWWPASDARVFFPVRMIPVAPIGLGMLSPRGLQVVLTELGPSIPLLIWAAWPIRVGQPQDSGDQGRVSRSRSDASEP